jgi:hypothetical protein
MHGCLAVLVASQLGRELLVQADSSRASCCVNDSVANEKGVQCVGTDDALLGSLVQMVWVLCL